MTVSVCRFKGRDAMTAGLCRCKEDRCNNSEVEQLQREGHNNSRFVQMQGQRKAHLQVRDSCLQLGCPVDQIVASVDQPLVMQAHKCLQDGICSNTRGVSQAACNRDGTSCCMSAAVSVQESFIAAKLADQQM